MSVPARPPHPNDYRSPGILFKNAFADFDRGGEGHVTVEQFKRVMSTLKCEVGGPGGEWADLLCRRYCDKGDSTSGKDMFNYRDFCRVCDPNDASLDRAEAENLAPYQQHQPDKYFDLKGRVYERQQ